MYYIKVDDLKFIVFQKHSRLTLVFRVVKTFIESEGLMKALSNFLK